MTFTVSPEVVVGVVGELVLVGAALRLVIVVLVVGEDALPPQDVAVISTSPTHPTTRQCPLMAQFWSRESGGPRGFGPHPSRRRIRPGSGCPRMCLVRYVPPIRRSETSLCYRPD